MPYHIGNFLPQNHTKREKESVRAFTAERESERALTVSVNCAKAHIDGLPIHVKNIYTVAKIKQNAPATKKRQFCPGRFNDQETSITTIFRLKN